MSRAMRALAKDLRRALGMTPSPRQLRKVKRAITRRPCGRIRRGQDGRSLAISAGADR